MKKNTIKGENILLISHMELDMILKREKWVVFQNEINENLISKLNDLYPKSKSSFAPESFYLKDKETGELLGEATSYLIFYLLYDVEREQGYRRDSNFKGVVEARSDALEILYLEWCSMKSLKPNPKEGWFKSKKFNRYLNQIGWGSNYAVFIHDVIKY
ncbi:hypothetical protein COE58_24135 [Bacillus cereus]|nr:hypothetical protein COE58_24135 [Bacillus cereus]